MSSKTYEREMELMWGDVVRVIKQPPFYSPRSNGDVKPIGSIGKVVDSTDYGSLIVQFDDGSRLPYIPDELELVE
jgi:hypothetical protein